MEEVAANWSLPLQEIYVAAALLDVHIIYCISLIKIENESLNYFMLNLVWERYSSEMGTTKSSHLNKILFFFKREPIRHVAYEHGN